MAKPTEVRGLSSATPMPEAARAFLVARLADVQRHLGKLGTRLKPDDVHDARVATRRLRAALTMLGDRRRVREADRVVKDLQDALGAVRDLQVQLDGFGKLSDQAGPLERTALRHLRQALAGELLPRAEALKEAMPRWERRGVEVLGRLEALEPKGRLGGHRFRLTLIAGLERLEARVIGAQEDPSPTPMHQLRKMVKRFRYLLELLEPAMPGEIEEIQGHLIPLQESLGNLHDTDVRLAVVDAHGDVRSQGTDSLLQRLRGDRDRQAQEVLRALETWEEEAVALRAQVLLSASPLKREGGPRAADRE